jgi:hypothetical protein
VFSFSSTAFGFHFSPWFLFRSCYIFVLRWRGSTPAMPMLEGFRYMERLWDPANSTAIRRCRET